jgi:WD40 repeat protein
MDGNRFALIVANSEYEDPELRQLQAPAHDAESLARVLKDPSIGGFEVQTLVNEPSGKVSQAIEEFFVVADRKRDDLLLLYFSGHGIKDDDGQLYFAARDTRLVRHKPLRATAVGAGFVSEMLRTARSRRQVLLLDCCYSGAFAKALMAKGDDNVGIRDHFQEGRGLVVLTASDSLQYSLEEDTAGSEAVRSVFTRHVVKALETGDADRDGDGSVSLDELYEYVLDRISQETPQQRPRKWDLDIEGRIYIARNPAPVKAAKLPTELQDSIEDRRPWVRLGAVQELANLLAGSHRGMALAASETLRALQADDSTQVRSAAAKCLSDYEAAQRPPQTGVAAAEAAVATAEEERLAKEKIEQERTAAARAEQERLEKEKAAQEELKRQKAEARRAAAQERLAKQKAEEERLAAERAEQERLAHEAAERERLAKQRAEQERLAAEKAEQERFALNKTDVERREREAAWQRAEAEGLAERRAKLQRQAVDPEVLERREKLRLEIERSKQERLARETKGGEQPAAAPAVVPPSPKRLTTFRKVLLVIGVLLAAVIFWPRDKQPPAQVDGLTLPPQPPAKTDQQPEPKQAAGGTAPLYKLAYTVEGHTGEVMQVSFSPDGKRLASAGRDSTVRFWDSATGKFMLSVGVTDANAVVFTPDGKGFASAGDSGAVGLYSAATGRQTDVFGDASVTSLKLPDGSTTSEHIYSLAFSTDGRFLAAAQVSGLKIYDVASRTQVPGPSRAPTAPLVVAFSPDGNWLAAAGNALGKQGPIRIWRVESWLPHHTLTPAFDAAALAFSHDGKLLASGGEDKTVRIWDVRTGEALKVLPSLPAKVRSLAFRPDGRELAAAVSGAAVLWNTETWGEQAQVVVPADRATAGAKAVNSVAFSPDGSLLATGGQERVLRVFRLE